MCAPTSVYLNLNMKLELVRLPRPNQSLWIFVVPRRPPPFHVFFLPATSSVTLPPPPTFSPSFTGQTSHLSLLFSRQDSSSRRTITSLSIQNTLRREQCRPLVSSKSSQKKTLPSLPVKIASLYDRFPSGLHFAAVNCPSRPVRKIYLDYRSIPSR